MVRADYKKYFPTNSDLFTETKKIIDKAIQEPTSISLDDRKILYRFQTQIRAEMKQVPFASILMLTSHYIEKRIELCVWDPKMLPKHSKNIIQITAERMRQEMVRDKAFDELKEELEQAGIEVENSRKPTVNDMANYKKVIIQKCEEDCKLTPTDGLSFPFGTNSAIIVISDLDVKFLEKWYEQDILKNADILHMVIAHECVELMYGINIQNTHNLQNMKYTPPSTGEFIANILGLELYLHHTIRHKTMHRVPRFYTHTLERETPKKSSLAAQEALIDAFIRTFKKQDRKLDQYASKRILQVIEFISKEVRPNRLHECVRDFGGLECPNGSKVVCEEPCS